jgi:hypothetical protein
MIHTHMAGTMIFSGEASVSNKQFGERATMQRARENPSTIFPILRRRQYPHTAGRKVMKNKLKVTYCHATSAV